VIPGTAWRPRLEEDLAAVPLDDPVRDREPETASVPIEVPRGVATVEALEDVRWIGPRCTPHLLNRRYNGSLEIV
jgi:hypothetical protein